MMLSTNLVKDAICLTKKVSALQKQIRMLRGLMTDAEVAAFNAATARRVAAAQRLVRQKKNAKHATQPVSPAAS